jgi:hypothetical protein
MVPRDINVAAMQRDRVVCTIKSPDRWVKAFQVFFGKDGSLFVNFPYCRHRTGLLSCATIPATGRQEAPVNLEIGGKITSHLVKYSHHPDGRAHFSQDGKIFTAIKRQSIALDRQDGHMFTVLIQGLGGLDAVDDGWPDSFLSAKRGAVTVEVHTSEAVKVVGRWLDLAKLQVNNPTDTIGPAIATFDSKGVERMGCLIASPYNNDCGHVLLLTGEEIPKFGVLPEVFMFCGGFDPQETMVDANKEAGFLVFTYPIVDADKLRQSIGTVDYCPKPS